jgi:hypothetical protein
LCVDGLKQQHLACARPATPVTVTHPVSQQMLQAKQLCKNGPAGPSAEIQSNVHARRPQSLPSNSPSP